MIAYFVHNSETQTDMIYLPEIHCFVEVDRDRMEAYISVEPDFASWSGQKCALVPPEEFGGVIATREDKGDISILNEELWKARMMAHFEDPQSPPAHPRRLNR